jgi:hypothetical protein
MPARALELVVSLAAGLSVSAGTEAKPRRLKLVQAEGEHRVPPPASRIPLSPQLD